MSKTNEPIPLILIVDDDRTMRSLLNLAMEEEGYRVLEAANGEQCLAEYTHFQPSLILLDAVMPDIDGFSCCRKIRSLPGGCDIPILMITVLDDRDSVEQAFDSGATDYITKPIYWSVLSQRVRRLLVNNQTRRELTMVKEQLRQEQNWSQLTSQILEQLVADKNKSNSIQQVLAIIRQWLRATRVLFYQSTSQIHWESVATGHTSINNFSATEVNLIAASGEQYQQETTIVIEDILQAQLPPAVIRLWQQLNITSLAGISIINRERHLGWLWIHFSQTFPQDRLSLNRISDLGNLLAIIM